MHSLWKKVLGIPVLASILLAGAAAPSRAMLTFKSTRGSLGANDSVDWGLLGGPFTSVSNPFAVPSSGGLSVNVSEASGTFERRDQGDGWAGNFAGGDRLLWTSGPNGPITLDFASPIIGAGSQIQNDFFGPFGGTVSAYDSGSSLLGSYSFGGNSSFAGDNSAIFVGLVSDSANVSRIVYDVTYASGDPADFAINRLDLITAAHAPEPCTLALLAAGSGPMLLALRRRRLRAV